MLVIPEPKKYDSSDRSIYYIVPIPFGPRQLLIISHGDSYHSLLAGLGVIEVDIAQWVLAGEPVGLMGHNSASRLDAGKPSLYIELRRKGQSIDPMPWIAVAQRKAR